LRFVTFDPETAAAHGFNDRLWLLVFYIAVGIGISLTTRFVGDVFSFAFLIIPASIAVLIAESLVGVFAISIVLGALIPPLAILMAFELDISSGPTAVLTAFVIFLIVYLVKKLKA
jgi:ABC-type Mn2+/Zn2+ transport system permease subunit